MSEIKTNKTLLSYKEKTEDSYTDIAKIAGINYDRVVKCFRDPGNVGAETMIGVCTAIHMPLDEAFELWISLHLKREQNTKTLKWERALIKK